MKIHFNDPVIQYIDDGYLVLKIEDWNTFFELSKHLTMFRFFYRGQSNINWLLSTSYERAKKKFQQVDGSYSNFRDNFCEFQSIQHFREEYMRFENFGSNIEWLAGMQHYGIPTRLLDITKSMMVALFFAKENIISLKQDICIWAMSSHAIYKSIPDEYFLQCNKNENFSSRHNSDIEGIKEYLVTCARGYLKKINYDIAEKLIKDEVESNHTHNLDPTYIIPLFPKAFNARMSAQDSLFLMPSNISKTFMENLSLSLDIPISIFAQDKFLERKCFCNKNIIPGSYKIIKIIISSKITPEIDTILKMSNVSAKSLFPGIEGIVKTMNEIKLFQKIFLS